MEVADLSFRQRALAEAARYGSDSWVFLRELLQNARDARARRVEITVEEDDDVQRLVCRDDGCGMTAEHAQRYLFALYASSKEDDDALAGQFGVGFWSVLRFKPRRLVIRSRPAGGDGWQVELDRRLDSAVLTSCDAAAGTEVVLERRRRRSSRRLADKVFDAVHRYGRFVMCCGGRQQPLVVTVNGRRANAEMTLPAPSSAFRRRGFRGMVALGSEPRVELFANGLFVRQAACLEDLLDETPAGQLETGASPLDLPGALAPQVLLDSRELEVLLARSDVRQTRHLKRLVRTAETELERLIERQLQAVRPQPWYLPLRALGRLRGAWDRMLKLGRRRTGWWLAPALLVGAVIGWTALGRTALDWAAPPRTAPAAPAGDADLTGDLTRYTDLGASYRGPRLDPPVADASRVALFYEPPDQRLFLTALVVDDPSNWSDPRRRQPVPAGRYEGMDCNAGSSCTDLRLVTGSGTLRIPVPTGHLLDPSSVRLDGRGQRVDATANGEPLLLETRQGSLLEYRTGPAPARASDRLPPRLPSRIPAGWASLASAAESLRSRPVRQRVAGALDEVARSIRYDRSPQAVESHYAARLAGRDFVEAALAVGQGDCDIQNGVLATLLRLAGVNARLAVGYVGRDGSVAPGLHAWVEYVDQVGRWQVADVSTRFTVEPPGSQLLWATGTDPDATSAPPANASPAGAREAFFPAAVAPPGGWTAPAIWIALLAATGLGWVILSRRSQAGTAVRLEPYGDLAALLGGAVQHPGLSRLPALMHGRFVPLHAGGAMSLDQAQRRAAAGTLYSSARGSRLALEAAERGRAVIDASAAEGRVTSLGLGAIDLDQWSDLIDRSADSPLVRHLNRYLESMDEDWRLAIASPLPQTLEVVDLARLELGRRQVLIDPRHADLAGTRLDERSDLAAFRLLDVVAAHLDLAPPDRARILAETARRAIVEGHHG